MPHSMKFHANLYKTLRLYILHSFCHLANIISKVNIVVFVALYLQFV